MLMRVTSEGIHSSINIRYFELNDIPYVSLLLNTLQPTHIGKLLLLLFSSQTLRILYFFAVSYRDFLLFTSAFCYLISKKAMLFLAIRKHFCIFAARNIFLVYETNWT